MIELLEVGPEDDAQITAVATTLSRHCTPEESRQFREDLATWQRQRGSAPNQPARAEAQRAVEQWQRLFADILRIESAEAKGEGQP